MDFTKLCVPKHIKKIIDNNLPTDIPLCTRFPPQPSGYMHVGHLFACRLNQTVANVYKGRFLVRFDDTNPEVESTEFTDAILEDLISCGFDVKNLSYTSDSFQLIIDKATQLVESGNAYVDFSTQEEMATQRMQLKGSPYRTTTIEENISSWNDMINGNLTSASLRLLAFPDSKNGAMRDPVLYRSLDVEHHRTKKMFKVYPTYDFACPVLDSYDGVTHIFRSKEYCERDDQMKLILSKLGMRIPKAITYGRLNVEDSVISKREIKKGIEDGIYKGWDDKKLFTYRGMRNRGITLEGLNKFLDDVGYPEGTIKVQQQKIFTINTKVIDKNTTRIIAIREDDVMDALIELQNPIVKMIPNFTGNKDLGDRLTVLNSRIKISKSEHAEFSEGEEVTVLHFGNVIYKSPNVFTPNFSGDPKKTSKKILWLDGSNYNKITLEMLNGEHKEMFTETHIDNINNGQFVQLNKMGYYYKKTIDGKPYLVEISQ